MTDFGAFKGSFLHHRVDVVPIPSTGSGQAFQGGYSRLHDVAGPGSGDEGHHGECHLSRYIGTDMVRALRPEIVDAIVQSIPVRRLGQATEIASIVSWLASDEAAFATGADFSLNGGLSMS
jgi:hypothetical protein